MKVSTASDRRGSGRGTIEARRRQRRRLRPDLLALEDRQLLSTFTVTSTLDDGSDGTLRWAVGRANTTTGADTIDFDSSFNTPQTITLGGSQLDLSDTTGATTITGPAGGVTVSGNDASRVFQIDPDVTASISGMTITGGNASNGGGLFNSGTLTLANTIVSGNSANSPDFFSGGGGLFNSGMATLTDCTVTGNSATSNGGGLFNHYGSTLSLAGCTVSGNSVGSGGQGGGGVFNNVGNVTLTGCTVTGNTAVFQGGGLTNRYGTTTLTNSAFSANSAVYDAGGLFANAGTTTLTDCTFSGNSAGRFGGGLQAGGNMTLTGCTVSGNSAGNAGGGILNFNYTLIMSNTTVSGNTASSGGGVTNFGGATTLTGCTVSGNAASNKGGGTYNLGGTIALTNCTVSSNLSSVASAGVPSLSTAGSSSGFPVSNSDLLQTNLSSSSVTGNIGDEEGLSSATSIEPLTNGEFGPAGLNEWPGTNPEVVMIHNGVQITYNLDTSTHPLGYDLTNINTYAGWRDPGRSRQDYTVLYSTVTDPNTFHVLDNVSAPSYFGWPSGTAAFLTSSTGVLVSNVASIQFSFPSTQDGYVGYRELDVLGIPSAAPAPTYGGGLYNASGDATLVNCTFSGNTAGTAGGGLYIAGGTATLTNTIVAGNNSDIAGTVSGSYNLIGTGGSGGLVDGVDGNIVGAANPGLASLGFYGGPTQTMALLPGSPAIGAGTSSGITTDQRGFALDSPIDIGAFQAQAGPLVVNSTADGLTAPGQLDLRQAVNLANVLGGDETITFDPTVFATPQTISLNGTQLELSDTTGATTITAPTGGLTVSGGELSRVFQVDPNVTASILGITITGGSAQNGGGLANFGTATLTNCTVSGNSATGKGGGLYISQSGSTTLTDCTVSDNSAQGYWGGGGLYSNGVIALTNCTVSGNIARVNGGGVYVNIGTATLTNCTVSDNSARDGGGLTIWSGTATLTNTIVAGNNSDILGNVSGSHNLIGAGGSGGLVDGADGNIVGVANPGLAPLGDYGGPTQTMALLPGSLAIDAGASGEGIPTTDQRGVARVGTVDIGAFESSGFTIVVTSGSGQAAGSEFAAPLVATVTANNPVEPVAGGLVTFTPPASGASATISGNPAVIGGDGTASATAASNAIAGSYSVLATGSGIEGTASFSLTNLQLVSIAVSPGDADLALGVAGQFIATGTFADGSTGDITGFVTDWESATPSVATISSSGLASALALGTSEITASLAGVTSPVDTLTVIAPSFVVNTTDDAFGFYSGTTSLREAIAGANLIPGQTITFDPSVFASAQTITLTLGQLELSNTGGTETITGPAAGVTVNAGGKSRVFQVDEGVTASISGMIITGGGNAYVGGGLFNLGTTTLTDCVITGNSASFGGGLNNHGTLTLNGCTISNNTAWSSGGGLQTFGGTLTLADCTVSGNSAGQSGGGLYINYGGTLSLTDSTVSDNNAYNGGGLWSNGTTTLTNVTISGNNASGFFGPGGGGLVNSGGDLTLTGCTVSSNSANGFYFSHGGGLASSGGNLTLTDCTITGNHANANFGNNGGGVYISNGGMATLTDCTINDNSAGTGGGVCINYGGTANLTDCIVSGNYADGGGGLAIRNGSTATVTDCTFTGNSAGGDAGGLSNDNGSTATIIGCVFTSNFTVNFNGGGMANAGGSTATVTDCTFTSNLAASHNDGGGGGLFNLGDSTLTVSGCTFTDNSSYTNGGGLTNYGGTLTVSDSNFTNNSAGNSGGGLANFGSATLTDCTISGNSARNSGAGVYLNNGGSATLTDCTISGNSASGGNYSDGAGVSIFGGGSATLTDCTISGNSAVTCAGMLINNSTATLTDCTISDNSASTGGSPWSFAGNAGGLCIYGGSATLTDCTISGNSASKNGGGFFLNSGATATLTDCTVSGNSAGNSGGGLYIRSGGNLELTNCTVSNNSAGYNGGGVFSNGTTTLTDCTVSGGSAGNNGGGLYSGFFATLALTNCTVSGNSATFGGGLLTVYSTTTLTSCTISGNSASVYGGGWLDNNGQAGGTTTLTDCTVSGNSSGNNGGGLFMVWGTTTLTNCTVSGNSSGNNGGGLYNIYVNATLTNCTVSGNSASNGGGLFNGRGTITESLGNTIVAVNTASASPDVSGGFVSLGNNLIGETDGSSGWVGSDLTGTSASPLDPLMAPLGDYGGPTQTVALLPGSPAIDAGSDALIPAGVTTDQRGLPRIVNSFVDIGAFESSGFTIAVTSGSGQSTGVLTAFPNPLVATVTANNPDEPVAGGLVTFTPPASGASAFLNGSPAVIGDDGTASVTAAANGFVGSYAVTASAGGVVTPVSFGLTNVPLIVALDPSAPGAMSLSGNSRISTSGIVYVNSSSSSALTASGNANVTAGAIDVHGGFVKSGNAVLDPTPVTGAPVLPVVSLPSPSTEGMTNYGSLSLGGNQSRTIQPGIYTKMSVSGNARLAMAPGIYIIEGGGFSVSGNASVTGSGVIIVNAGSNYPTPGGNYGGISLGGGATFDLSPPTSGTYAGIVIFQPEDNPKIMTVTTNASGIAGTIYAPGVALSESSNAALNTSLIVKRLSLSGNGIVNGPSQGGPAIAVSSSNAVAVPGGNTATPSSIGAVSVLEQPAPATIPIKLKVRLTDALGNSVSASSLPAVSMAEAVSTQTLVSQSEPGASQPDGLFSFKPTSVTFRFNPKARGAKLGS